MNEWNLTYLTERILSCLRCKFPVSLYTGRIVSSRRAKRCSNDDKIPTIPFVSWLLRLTLSFSKFRLFSSWNKYSKHNKNRKNITLQKMHFKIYQHWNFFQPSQKINFNFSNYMVNSTRPLHKVILNHTITSILLTFPFLSSATSSAHHDRSVHSHNWQTVNTGRRSKTLFFA